MKIIAHIGSNYLVEMTEDEIVKSAGFLYSFDSQWEKLRTNLFRHERSSGGKLPVGSVINVHAAFNFHSQITEHEQKAKDAAATLRALAGLLDGAMPSVVIPPTTDAAPAEGASQ
jgi:hypothetical protein